MRNAYEILSLFRRTAMRAGWGTEEIQEVLDDAKSGDYEHLNEVILEAMARIDLGETH